MRPRVPWMNEVDDAILEYFEELEGVSPNRILLNPTAVYMNLVIDMEVLDRSDSTIQRRMRILNKIGLLEKVGGKRAYYRITDKGLKYLSGELDAGDLPNPTED